MQCNQKKNKMKKHVYTVVLKDAMSDTKRVITIKTTSMINVVRAMEEIRNLHEYILEIKMVKL